MEPFSITGNSSGPVISPLVLLVAWVPPSWPEPIFRPPDVDELSRFRTVCFEVSAVWDTPLTPQVVSVFSRENSST